MQAHPAVSVPARRDLRQDGTGYLTRAISASSAKNVWAVGDYGDGNVSKTLTLHWDGTAWTQIPSPPALPTTNSTLRGVSVSSPIDAWAVGSYTQGFSYPPLVLHGNGTAWKKVSTKEFPPGYSELDGVADTSDGGARVTGYNINRNGSKARAIALHRTVRGCT